MSKRVEFTIVNGVLSKVCSFCAEPKSLDGFYKVKGKYLSWCIKCQSLKRAKFWTKKAKTKESLLKTKEYNRQYRQKNKEVIKEKFEQGIYKRWCPSDEQSSQYSRNHRQKDDGKTFKIIHKKYYQKHTKDPGFRILGSLRARLHCILKAKNIPKLSSVKDLVGCSWPELIEHIESLWKPNMCWDNYGKWHIDHIIPCKAFDFSNKEEQLKCFKYTNLQPLWKIENLKKGTK